MSEHDSSFQNSHTFNHAFGNVPIEPEPKTQIQSSPTAFVASGTLGIPGISVDTSSLSPVLEDTASKARNHNETGYSHAYTDHV